jgi:hypothetical protein
MRRTHGPKMEELRERENFRDIQLRILYYVKACPITGLNRPTEFQEVKAPRFLDIGT